MLTFAKGLWLVLAYFFIDTCRVEAAQRGLAWATDNRWATQFSGTAITWYHHWQDAAVSQFASGIEYVPMNWGPAYYNTNWQARVKQMNVTLPNYILAYNEPDVPTQANMTPSEAVTGFMADLQPYRNRGVKVSSPQIVWNTTWMSAFMTGLKAQGGDVDYMAIHYYGSWNDYATPKAYIQKVYNRWGKNIWITELGTTNASGGTEQNQIDFMNHMLDWIDNQTYIERVVWSGAWAVTTPPDDFINAEDGIFFANSSLRAIGLSYAGGQLAPSLATTTTVTATPTSTSSTTTMTMTLTSTVATTTTTAAPRTTTTATITSTVTPTSTSPTTTPTSTSTSTSTTTSTTSSTTTVRTTTTTSTKAVTTTRTTTTSSSAKATSTCRYYHNKKRAVNKGNVAIRRELE